MGYGKTCDQEGGGQLLSTQSLTESAHEQLSIREAWVLESKCFLKRREEGSGKVGRGGGEAH